MSKEKPLYPFPEDMKCPVCGGQLETVSTAVSVTESLLKGGDDIPPMIKFVCSKEGHIFVRGEKSGLWYLVN
jgi:hypothetical protein